MVVTRPASAADVGAAVIASRAGTPVRVGDVATVHDTYEEATELQRIDGRPAVSFDVVKAVGTNTVRAADRVKARLARLEATLPYGAAFVLVDDESEDIRRQLSDLRLRAVVAAAVIFLVLLGFLGSFRSAAVVFATIAFSVLIALNLVYFGGLSLNLLTLMGLAMGFGLVVDNAIVVLENVFRRWQAGEAAPDAAEAGTRDVVLPILASTATTLIVFVPFVYLQGELRVFYVPLAVVVALTLVASLFVAFTFVPALSARLLSARAGRGVRAGGVLRGGGHGGDPSPASGPPAGPAAHPPLYVRFYAGLLDLTLRHPWPTVAVAAVLLAGSWTLFDRYVTRGVVWGGGWGQQTYILINVELPRGSNLERTDQLVRFFEERLAGLPEVERFTTTVNQTSGRIEVTFPDSLESTYVPVAIKERMFGYSHTFTGAQVRVYGYGPSFYGGGGAPPTYGITVLGYNFERVREIAESLGGRIARLSRVAEVDTNASGAFTRDRASEFVVRVDRDAVSRHGLTVRDLVARMNAAVGGGGGLARVKLGGEEVDVRVALSGADETDVLALEETLLQGPGGEGIRLGDLVGVESRDVLANIHRENQQYERRVAYEFRGPRRLGDLVQEAVIASTEVPPGYTVEKAEGWRFGDQERQQVLMVLLVALTLVYMVTAALFESLRQPLCVILTVPMAAIGIFMIFFYTGATFTREAYIGAIMTGGIVVNNAILLVDHLNRVRSRRGLRFEAAVVTATLERVRPILMTTATTVLGLLPLVAFSGADENIWNALGFTLIGGLLSSTLLVLTVTPALYLLMERGRGEAALASRILPPAAAAAGAD
ncbi:MAG: efflux RND transporter permease subunit [Gemmatimonadetes bacterium]|nr:efflux RND transporter permease subunit [Gemmatimonadota bacterium]